MNKFDEYFNPNEFDYKYYLDKFKSEYSFKFSTSKELIQYTEKKYPEIMANINKPIKEKLEKLKQIPDFKLYIPLSVFNEFIRIEINNKKYNYQNEIEKFEYIDAIATELIDILPYKDREEKEILEEERERTLELYHKILDNIKIINGNIKNSDYEFKRNDAGVCENEQEEEFESDFFRTFTFYGKDEKLDDKNISIIRNSINYYFIDICIEIKPYIQKYLTGDQILDLLIFTDRPGKYEIPKFSIDLKENEDFLLETIKLYPLISLSLPREKQTNKEFIFKAINIYPNLFFSLPSEIQEDVNFSLKVIKLNPKLFLNSKYNLSLKLYENKEFLLKIFEYAKKSIIPCSAIFKNISNTSKLLSDEDFILKTTMNVEYILECAFYYASDSLKNNKDFILKILKLYPESKKFINLIIIYMNRDLRNNKKFLLEAIQISKFVLYYISFAFDTNFVENIIKLDNLDATSIIYEERISFQISFEDIFLTKDKEVLIKFFKFLDLYEYDPYIKSGIKSDMRGYLDYRKLVNSIDPKLLNDEKFLYDIIKVNLVIFNYIYDDTKSKFIRNRNFIIKASDLNPKWVRFGPFGRDAEIVFKILNANFIVNPGADGKWEYIFEKNQKLLNSDKFKIYNYTPCPFSWSFKTDEKCKPPQNYNKKAIEYHKELKNKIDKFEKDSGYKFKF